MDVSAGKVQAIRRGGALRHISRLLCDEAGGIEQKAKDTLSLSGSPGNEILSPFLDNTSSSSSSDEYISQSPVPPLLSRLSKDAMHIPNPNNASKC